ncbi:MAG: hypothetical protein AAF492_29505, partial [Verrucomicrobiota bacterium]
MKEFVRQCHESFKQRRLKVTPGVDSIWTPRWLLVTACYFMAIGFMGRDPWFGDQYFAWNQGVIVILLSFIVVSTLCFEWHLMGRTEGVNVFLQLFLIFPFALFLGRIIGKPWNYSGKEGLLGDAVGFVTGVLNASGISSLVPRAFQDMFSSPGLTAFFILVCLALSVGSRKATRVGLLITAILIPLASTFAYMPRPSSSFYMGAGFMFLGAGLQYLDV